MGKKIMQWSRVRPKIIRLYGQQWTLRRIARLYKTTPVTIASWLARWKVPRRGVPHGGRKRKSGLEPIVIGMRYGLLTVIEKDPMAYPARWLVECGYCSKRITLSQMQILKGACKHRGPLPSKV